MRNAASQTGGGCLHWIHRKRYTAGSWSACGHRSARLRVHPGRSHRHAARPQHSQRLCRQRLHLVREARARRRRARAARPLPYAHGEGVPGQRQLRRRHLRREPAHRGRLSSVTRACCHRRIRRSRATAIGIGHRDRVTSSASTIRACAARTRFPGATVPADCWMVEKNRCQ